MKTVAIIGAGPIGLAAAAQLLEHGLNPIVFEAGPQVGHAVRQWGHVKLFSPWSKNVDKAAERLLHEVGWVSPDPDRYMTGADLVAAYLEPLAYETKLSPLIQTYTRVTGIARHVGGKSRSNEPSGGFDVQFDARHGSRSVAVDAVIDASGVWFSPNPAGANGLPAPGESECSTQISYGMPDVRGGSRGRYRGRTVGVLGAGHSAIGTLIELVSLAVEEPHTKVIWIHRGTDVTKAFGRGSRDQLSARGELGLTFADLLARKKIEVVSGFHVRSINKESGRLVVADGSAASDRTLVVDELIVCTGFRPDLAILRELRLDLDPSIEAPRGLAPLIDQNLHSCGTVRLHGADELSHPLEPGFFVTGIKSYGRAPTFLMMTGYEQVRSIAAALASEHVGEANEDSHAAACA